MLPAEPSQRSRSQWDLRIAGNIMSQIGSRVSSIGSDLHNLGTFLQRRGSELMLSDGQSQGSVFSDSPF